jgi:signal transduction histidine kinase
MRALKQFLRQIPYWAYLLVLTTVTVNTAYLYYRGQKPMGGATVKVEKGCYIHDFVTPGSSIYKAGIRTGDTLVSLNSIPVDKWEQNLKVGDTVVAGILRNNREVAMPVIVGSLQSFAPGFFWSIYIIIVFFSIGSLYLLHKKPDDKSAQLFFICIQLFMMVVNALNLFLKYPMAMFANMAFQLSGCFLGPALIHFHLLFPRPAKFFSRYKWFPMIFYTLGFFIFIGYSTTYFNSLYSNNALGSFFSLFDRIVVSWMTLTFFLALAIVIFQFRTIRDTLSRNQLRIVITGTFFGFISPMSISMFYNEFSQLSAKYPIMGPVSQGTGTLILISCILIAIFRYRIWDIEIFIRKALLYLGATLIILVSYLVLIYLVDLMMITETNITRFLILAISVIIFLILRDRIQRLIDRFFHRETYDSATVVSDFEEKLAGIYRVDELKQRIGQSLDEIFHFKSFVFALKTKELRYEPVVVTGIDAQRITGEFDGNTEFEMKLSKSKVFSPDELNVKPAIFNMTNGELVVPLLAGDQPDGFFICGPKKSERVYSLQDIRVLSLLARRVTALFHTASLYQKDLDRQLLLERERARISQDMHDDIGAGLTRIAMISEAKVKIPDQGRENKERMSKVATTAREMIARLNVIVWALNPKYDTLDSLVAYSRRYFGEYLDNSGIRFNMELPEVIPELSITPDFRRNAFYALQEAIHNAVKHGACSEIKVGLKFSRQKMEITITDNGKGFDQNQTGTHGNGLLNMKKRAEDLGGSFGIQSSPGRGTRVLFLVTLTGSTTLTG